MDKAYNHNTVEDRIYKFWEGRGYFSSEPKTDKDRFVLMMPPPNITGRLHIGHALNFTLQDVFVRFNRMLGRETLWLPGIDHAGIATQSVVERELQSKGVSREQLGRDAFVSEVWKWKETYGNIILEQLKKLGASPDWRRLRFTLDEKYADAVLEAFVRYYEAGYLYRGERIINWCPRCHTALSDIEVEYSSEKSLLYYIAYPVADSQQDVIVVATTRPETMLGDTAVAVHPDDERYKKLAGRELILPIIERRIPVVFDSAVDPDFGTGAVKVTPAHSSDDFDIAIRHNLPLQHVIDDRGKMKNVPNRFFGLTSDECRQRVVEELKQKGYLVKIEDYEHSVGHCQRCGTVVEPLVSRQWFLKMKELADAGKSAVKEGLVKVTPEKWVKVYYDWLDNIRDWCVSRQLWWGHRIPAYYCTECGEVVVKKAAPQKCPNCGSEKLVQDEDVLDTWFSSALWPFATLGWPESTEDLTYYYPTTLLITGYDILFFWVARMIMSGMYFTGKQPFDTVMLHGLVRDEKGRKMSKSLKNIVDPLQLIDEYGADALRFTLAYLSTVGGQDVNLSREKLKASRNFVNKIWNASRFVYLNLGDFRDNNERIELTEMEIEDKWILSRLNRKIVETKQYLNAYDPGGASRSLYEFVWGEFCDWYIELSKIRLYGNDEAAKRTAKLMLSRTLLAILKLLHPFIPFVTEEIYQQIKGVEPALIISKFPEEQQDMINDQIEKEMEFIFETIRAIRSVKTAFSIPIVKEVRCYFTSTEEFEKQLLERECSKIMKVAGVSNLEAVDRKPPKTIREVVGGTTLYIELPSGVEIDVEEENLKKKLDELNRKISAINGRIMNPVYLEKADQEVIEKDKSELSELEKTKRAILSHLEDLKD